VPKDQNSRVWESPHHAPPPPPQIMAKNQLQNTTGNPEPSCPQSMGVTQAGSQDACFQSSCTYGSKAASQPRPRSNDKGKPESGVGKFPCRAVCRSLCRFIDNVFFRDLGWQSMDIYYNPALGTVPSTWLTLGIKCKRLDSCFGFQRQAS
jgi:hypothetical protein